MWMNPYVQDFLIREQIADAQLRAARNHLLRHARPRGAPGDAWERVRATVAAIGAACARARGVPATRATDSLV